ncbi:flagella basal body P-ring formation protein FlgA [Aliifodinibius salipaludis]|uniref:Flagella basal body P-ring formation protein FlgA n=1 Tax=Fodinibius salipaludis TaxID=2032627 RepID=A0A2A2GCU1_9BACT|nr:flagellar basal body P-ring formation chaperone FlgA [Aliifodinibius salipaludis]PAU94602.1 flagella basal body P-ring formation protein FlgA [Aliifodinibius salipaludis]
MNLHARIIIISLLVFIGLGAIPARADIDMVVDDEMKSFIMKKAHKQLERHFATGEYRFDIQPRWIPNQLLQQSPGQVLSIQLSGQIRRYTNFEVVYNQRGNRKRAEVQLKVNAEQKLPVVTDRVRKGSKLEEEHLSYQWVSISQSGESYISRIEELIGKTLRRTLLSGQSIRKSYVSRDLIIKAGDEVSVFIKRRGIQVQVSGVAREDGAKGDRIKIFSNETNRKYVGEVLRPGVLQWKNTL